MKTKYERLSKEEKKQLNNDFINGNKEISKKISRIISLCVAGVIYGLFVFIYDILIKNNSLNIILDLFVFVVSSFGFIKVNKTKTQLLNTYLLKKENDNKKKIFKSLKKSS